jgi:hypothetical protein
MQLMMMTTAMMNDEHNIMHKHVHNDAQLGAMPNHTNLHLTGEKKWR